MKNVERNNINSEKLLKNEELITLRGGDENPCGAGFDAFDCSYKFVGEEWYNEGLCCIPVNLEPLPYVEEYNYPKTLDIYAWNYCKIRGGGGDQ